jgi:hypothetical protein
MKFFIYFNRSQPKGLNKIIPCLAAGCLSEGEVRAGTSSRSRDFFGSFFHRMELSRRRSRSEAKKRDRKHFLIFSDIGDIKKTNMIRILTLIILAMAILPMNVLSQNSLDETLKTYFTKFEKGESTFDVSEKLLTFKEDITVKAVEVYTTDSSSNKRYAVYRLINYLGHHITNPLLNKDLVMSLVNGCNDKDAGIVGANLKNLATFDAGSFDAEMKYILSEMVKKPHSHYQMLIKLCGWLQIKDLNYNFRQMLTDKKINARDRWAMRIAMARMGETDMIDYCLQKIKSTKVNDDVIYELVPDMIYTRQKPMFDYLLQIIESDDKNCGSGNPDSDVKMVCGFSVIEMIAPYIENFPVKVRASGDIDARDYEKALLDVRNWIKLNREIYVIRNKGF